MRDKRVYTTVAAVATVGLILGSFLPWARLSTPFGEFTKIALEDESDQIITLALGAVAVWAVAHYYFGQGRGLARSLILTALGAAVIAVAVVDLADTQGRASGTLRPRCYWAKECTPRLSPRCWGTHRSLSLSTSTATLPPPCSGRRWRPLRPR